MNQVEPTINEDLINKEDKDNPQKNVKADIIFLMFVQDLTNVEQLQKKVFL